MSSLRSCAVSWEERAGFTRPAERAANNVGLTGMVRGVCWGWVRWGWDGVRSGYHSLTAPIYLKTLDRKQCGAHGRGAWCMLGSGEVGLGWGEVRLTLTHGFL